ncbi:hypothetical protein EVAR_37236_1 [Eumeta japonica]|uniref:Uncharacterized protein n=1 Tax=Eumeta variegata TaxID=151549 RepID=A0A4C1Y4I8_EUMVA|nr:hypothetical protein EVAR_37236_1 [Eumeta japonica]
MYTCNLRGVTGTLPASRVGTGYPTGGESTEGNGLPELSLTEWNTKAKSAALSCGRRVENGRAGAPASACARAGCVNAESGWANSTHKVAVVQCSRNTTLDPDRTHPAPADDTMDKSLFERCSTCSFVCLSAMS